MVLSKPKLFDEARGQKKKITKKNNAHVLQGGLDAWVKSALRCLAPRGQLVLIHRADALADILAALERRFGDVHLRFVQPRQDAPAIRVLVRATLASRGPLVVLPPLNLQGDDGAFTPRCAAIHEGTATLDWGRDQQTR